MTAAEQTPGGASDVEAPLVDSDNPWVPPALVEAVRDTLWRMVACGEDDEGWVTHYLVTAGTVHRLVGAAASVGLDAPLRNGEELPDPSVVAAAEQRGREAALREAADEQEEMAATYGPGPASAALRTRYAWIEWLRERADRESQ